MDASTLSSPGFPDLPVPAQERAAVVVLVESRYRAQAQPAGLIEALVARGVRTEVVDPGRTGRRARIPVATADVVVARGRSVGVFAALRRAERRGVPTVNRCGAITSVHDKAVMTRLLTGSGLPTPTTWVGVPGALVGLVPRHAFPVVVKPVYGDNARDVRRIESPDELAAVPWSEPVALVQRWIPNDGYDIKVYGIAERMWAVRKPSPLSPCDAAGERVELTGQLAAIGRRCRLLTGLDLFGVDCVAGPDGLEVIEVNDFPNYTCVPGAGAALADAVLAASRTRRSS